MARRPFEAFKKALEKGDAEAAASFYTRDAALEWHQAMARFSNGIKQGQDDIRDMFKEMFAQKESQFKVTSFFTAKGWGGAEWIYSWADSEKGDRRAVRGASIFEFRGDKVVHERIYYGTTESP